MNIYSCEDCGEHFNDEEIKVVMLPNKSNSQDKQLQETEVCPFCESENFTKLNSK